MKSTYIVVADNVRARIFTAETPSSSLQEIDALAHTEGRLHDREMTSDLPGKIKGEGSMGHAFEQPPIRKNTKQVSLRIVLPVIWKKRTMTRNLNNC